MAYDESTRAAFRARVEAILANVPGISVVRYDELQGTTMVDVVGEAGRIVYVERLFNGSIGVTLSSDDDAFGSGADHALDDDAACSALIRAILRTGERKPSLQQITSPS